MRSIIFFVFVFIATVCMHAQTIQLGVVKEYNEKAKKTPLPGVEVRVKSAGSTTSGEDGRFRLEFLTLNPGQSVIVRSIEKLGYEIFNKEALEQWSINPDKPFLIVMCRSDKFKRLRDNYESKASASYNKQYKKEIAAIDNLKKEGKIKDEEYRNSLREIQDAYDRQLDNLDNYVDRFARIDLSEISADEQAIIELVQQGRFDEAIAKYDEMKIVSKLITGIRERQDIKSAQEQLAKLESVYAESIDSLYAMAERQIGFLKLAGGVDNNKKIANICITIAEADSTNADWLTKTGEFLSELMGDYPRAMEYFEKALAIDEKALGAWHPKTAISCNNIGVVCGNMGDYQRAMEFYEKALAIQEKILGAEHPKTATSYNNIGGVLYSMGDDQRALEYFEKALTIRKKALGTEHPETATSYNNIGLVYDSMGNYQRAMEYYEKTLAIQKSVLGAEHSGTATAYNNIGSVYDNMGDDQRALEYFEKALTIRKKALGAEHPNTATSYNNIGFVYYNMGDDSRALEYFKKALAIQEKTLGTEHPNTATSYNNLGGVYDNMRDYPRALEYYEKALAIQEKILGAEQPDIAIAYNNLGGVYYNMGDDPRALEFYEKALAIYEKTLGAEHPTTATAYKNLGLVYKTTGDYTRALEYYKKALAIREKVFGTEHPNTALIYESIGMVYYTIGDYPQAQEFFLKSNTIFERAGFVKKTDILMPYIYDTYCKIGKTDKSLANQFAEFMSDKIPTMIVKDGGAAASQGMSGEYFILEFGDWHLGDSESLFDKSEELKDKAKRIVTMKDGKVCINHFQHQIGVQYGIKKIGATSKQNIVKLYNQWKVEDK